MVLRLKKGMTTGEYERVAANLGPSELVRGEVVLLMAGGIPHSEITGNVHGLLWQWARKTGLGRVMTNEAGVVTRRSPDTVRGLDVAYFSYARLPKGRTPPGFSKIPPELAVEVIGKGQGWQKMIEKAGEYLDMGVDRVWIIDPKTRRVHVMSSDGQPQVFSTRQMISDPEILPGFSCRVREFFGE